MKAPTEEQRLHRKENNRRAYRRRHQEAGLCIFCPRPANGKLRCKYHLNKDFASTTRYRRSHPQLINEKQRKVREQMKEEGRCIRCRLILSEQDEGRVKCQNCREQL